MSKNITRNILIMPRVRQIGLLAVLLSSASIPIVPAHADASLDELKAKLERAEKENIILKTEKIERENITMKLEKIEAENATLRNEMKVDKTPTASIPAQKTASGPASNSPVETKAAAKKEQAEMTNSTPLEHIAARREINHMLDSIPKNDASRDMTAAYKAPREEVPVVVKQWQGVYAGINAGYGRNLITSTSTTYGPAEAGQSSSSFIVEGPVVGGQFGYNYQFNNNVVVGAEADIDYADINSTTGTGLNNNFSAINLNGVLNINQVSGYSNTSLNWLGTVRGRIGFSIGNFLPYVTGGFAYGGVSSSSYSNFLFGYTYPGWSYRNATASGGNYHEVTPGWAAGVGAEYKVAENWSVKGEYLFTSIGGLSFPAQGSRSTVNEGNNNTNPATSTPSLTNSNTGSFGVHQARVGLNYHTDWLASKPAVGAKY